MKNVEALKVFNQNLIKNGEEIEALGDISEAIKYYQELYNEYPEEKIVLQKLSLLYLNAGDEKEAVKYFEKYFEENEDPEYEMVILYGGILEAEDNKKASNFYKKMSEILDSTELRNISERLIREEHKEEIVDSEIEENDFSTEDILEIFSYFSGREDNYAIQWRKESGEIGFVPANQPLSFNVLRKHLRGEQTIGIYQLNLKSQTKWLLFDLDVKKRIVEKQLAENKDFKFYQYQALSFAREIETSLSSIGLKSYIEYSGFKGYHVWVFFEDFVSSKKVKKLGEEIISSIKSDILKNIIDVEIFPKQESLKDLKLGNLVKLPFGIHLKSGKRSYFLNEENQPLTIKEFFEKAEKNPIDKLSKIIEVPLVEEENEIRIDESERYDVLSDSELQFLMSKCRVIDFLINKIVWEKKVSSEEFSVIKYTVGHLTNGSKIINALLGYLNIEDETLEIKKKLSGYPMSCRKIKQKIPEITVRFNCDCTFPSELGYKHPILHIKTSEIELNEQNKEKQESIKLQKLIEQYLQTRKELKEKANIIKEVEKRIYEYFDERNINEIKTEFSTLKRIYHPDGTAQLIMEI